MDRSRRKFLKKAFWLAGGGAAGFAYLNSIGIGPKEAKAIGVESHATTSPVGAGPNTSWATWDETTEAGWGDSANTFICLMENVAAGGNEIGQGAGLSEANRTLTQVGNVAGATGTPPSRYKNATTQYFTLLSAVPNLITGGGNWSVIVKSKLIAGKANSTPWSFFGAADHTYAMFDAAGKVQFRCQKDYGNPMDVLSTDAMTIDSTVNYTAMWYDGTYIRGGFIDSGSPTPNTKPTKWSDFNANDRGSVTTTINWTAGDFGISRFVGGYYSTSYLIEANMYYIIVLKTCLIDNAA